MCSEPSISIYFSLDGLISCGRPVSVLFLLRDFVEKKIFHYNGQTTF